MRTRLATAIGYVAFVAVFLWTIHNSIESDAAWWVLLPAFFLIPFGVGVAVARWWALPLPLVAFALEAPVELSAIDPYREAVANDTDWSLFPPFFLSFGIALWHTSLITLGVILAKAIAAWRRPVSM